MNTTLSRLLKSYLTTQLTVSNRKSRWRNKKCANELSCRRSAHPSLSENDFGMNGVVLLSRSLADTPQFRGGNPYFFSENPYQSVSFIYASMYRENVHAIHIAMQFGKKSRHCVIKIDSQQQRPKIGASFHVARQWDYPQ